MENTFLQANEISCRIQQINSSGLTLLLYVTSRDGQKRLDDKYGCLGWQDRYVIIDGDLFCVISAWDKDNNQWVSKSDVGTASYMAKEKGRASDAFKRACVKHGIGRELYTSPIIWIPSNQCNIKDKDGKYYCKDKFTVNWITYTSDGKIDELEIVNQDLNIVFKQYSCGKIDDIKHKVLEDKLMEAEIGESVITELFHIKSLAEMDVNMWYKCIRKLEVTIAEKTGKK